MVSGSLRATDTLYSTAAQFQILHAPIESDSTTYGPGTGGQILKSNGTSVYWTTLLASDIPNLSTDKLTSGTLPVGRGGTGQTSIANIQAGKDGDGNTISSTYLKLSGGTLTGNLISQKFLHPTITGTGTAAVAYNASTSTNGKPALWKFNLSTAVPSEGDIITITVPIAGHANGVFISTDNGTTYKPVSTTGTNRLSTHYGVGTTISLVYDADGATNGIYPVDGGTATTNVTGGCWRIINYYDANNYVTQTATTTNATYEILFSGTADNTSRTETARKTSTLTYNPSTKNLSTGGKINGLTFTAATTGFTISGGTTSKTLTVNADYTLASACAKSYTDSSSASAISSTGTSLTTERDIYYGLPTINDSHAYTSSTSIYAPTSAGTANQILVSAGGTSAPTWKATANGAAYATGANGDLTFGALPVAQGGTGASSAADARANLVAAKYIKLTESNTDTWAHLWTELNDITINEVATFTTTNTSATQKITGGKITQNLLHGTVVHSGVREFKFGAAMPATGSYLFFVLTFSENHASCTVSTVYRLEGTAM